MDQAKFSARLPGYLYLVLCALVGVALVFLFLDSYQQDGGNHFIFARWGWRHPDFFIGVWTRPLFTFLYSIPGQLGYRAAKLFAVLISVLAAWQTWKIAEFYKLERSPLVILFLLLQPTFFLMWADTMTEPLFALVFAVALHLHLKGWVRTGAFVASLMLLARPEGFFLGAMWGFWILFDPRVGKNILRRIPWTLLLASGGIIWIGVSWAISGDIQYIRHVWPKDWDATGASYGSGPAWDYLARLPEIVGPMMMVPFLVGIVAARRRMPEVTSSVVTLFLVHSIFRTFGMFGSAGYARYFVCVAPAIAVLTLVGWNKFAEWLTPVGPKVRATIGIAVLLISGTLCFLYTDASSWSRDARAVQEMHTWWKSNERPVSKLVWSQAYQNIVMDRDPLEKPYFTSNKDQNLKLLQDLPSGTLVFWDGQTGPAWYKLTADDIEAAGFHRLRSQVYILRGYLINSFWFGYGGPRRQEMHLLYKE
ncbi:MAG: hypothetical protein ABIP75_17710 [Pyrinomonadaceae bacterium]